MRVNAKLKPDDDSFELGELAENLFVTTAKKKGYTCEKSSRKADMHKHIDYFLKKGNKTRSFDVKSRKRTNRNDKEFNDDWIWIEFKNVQGKKGWLYGEADYIAFEREKSFLVVRREDLADLCKEIVDLKAKVTHAKAAKYKSYTRWKRKDVLSQIQTKDITKNTKTWNWKV